MTRLTKFIVALSLLAALAFESWQGRFLYPYLPALTALAALLGLVGGRLAPRQTVAAILLVSYWVPILFVAATRRPFQPSFFTIWSAGLAGLMLADRERLTWSYPTPWRFALILWALSVALVWPLTAFREFDFESFELLERYRVSSTGLGGSPTMMVSWMSDVAVLHLLGLLLFDWLFRSAAAHDPNDFEEWLALPLAVGATTGAALAVYQGAIDLGFLSGSVWPSMGRAAGSLLDANTSGMVAGMWSAGLLAFTRIKRARALGIAGAVICWCGLWMTGSRTALLAAGVALLTVGMSVIRTRGLRLHRNQILVAASAAALILVALVVLPIRSPLQRLRYMPTFAGDAGAGWLVHELWDRSSYGGAAATLIADHPFVGIGIGMFHLVGADYVRTHLHTVPPDNAQNWWRHNIVELGAVGSLGLLLWTFLFFVKLVRTGGEGDQLVPSAALKGALVAIGLASMFGMPAQSLPVAITFWTFAFWYTRLVDRGALTPTGDLRRGAWTAMSLIVIAYLAIVVVAARGSLRPVTRAADGGWPYVYGMYQPPVRSSDGGESLWTERHGVAVIRVDGSAMVLTIRAEHPDINQRPVRAIVKVNGHTLLDAKLSANVPIVRTIEMGPAPRAILEARVDHTWTSVGSSAQHPEVGLALSWRFTRHP